MDLIVPCLWLDRQAEEAAAFYVSIFPDSKITNTTYYAEDTHGREGEVLTVEFELRGQRYTALNGGAEFTFSEAVSFQVMCADQDEVDDYWAQLTADGGEEGPCGWCKDKFGLSWQVVPTSFTALLESPERSRVAAAMQAMYQMKKLDIAELERAFNAG